jgi:RNA polymerase sigma-54 factor
VAAGCGVGATDLERALRLVQTFDPTGVGARDLRECLLLQLDALAEPRPLARAIVADHLAELEGRPLTRLADALGVTVQEVQEAVEVIRSLEPKPGRTFGTEDPRYITPDVYIVKVDGRYVVVLNDEGLPRLRVSPHYRQILAAKSGSPREVRDYVESRMRSGLWLIRSIEQRQRTLYKVTESLVRFQRDFLEKGIMALRPLTLKEVAEDIGMHESTVSRVTTNKYVHTPQGLFELKYFFHRGVPVTSGSETASSLKVKELVRQLLTVEDSGKPLSDQKIVEVLRVQHNIDIARRTVAKYRSQLKIPSSSRRKRY